MRAALLMLTALLLTPQTPGAQEPPTRTTERAWSAYLAATVPACGLRDAAWGEALQRGLLEDALRDPERWGIPIRRTLGVRYADPIGTNYAQGAIGMARHIGTLLHARMQSRTCAEAARVATMSDSMARRGANAAAPEPLPEEAGVPGALIFVASLASGPCRLRGKQWFEDAFPQLLARMPPGPPSGSVDREARQRANGILNGVGAFADQSPAIAHRVFGASLRQSLRTWPELREADAAATTGARLRTRPGGALRDVQPVN